MTSYLNATEEEMAASHNTSELLAMVVTRLDRLYDVLVDNDGWNIREILSDQEKAVQAILLLQTNCIAANQMRREFEKYAVDAQPTAKNAAEYWS